MRICALLHTADGELTTETKMKNWFPNSGGAVAPPECAFLYLTRLRCGHHAESQIRFERDILPNRGELIEALSGRFGPRNQRRCGRA